MGYVCCRCRSENWKSLMKDSTCLRWSTPVLLLLKYCLMGKAREPRNSCCSYWVPFVLKFPAGTVNRCD